MKRIVIVLLMFCVGFTYAQEDRTLKFNKEKELIEVVYYHDNGQISQTGFYTKEGKLHGDWYSYCQEGNKITSAKYDNGQKVGKWFYWSGDVLKEVDYSKNRIAKVSEWTNKTTVASNK
ncbi:toxin-antitoxin system YwqK family antitoxin [Winogradskyella jejuensis]|uniref:MORN repeat variant n=1 Tax=Winogradskyella jejuensis TaxID=1089305 RepID=A0A1M5NP55_9FLAO|nr:nicotinic acid mononucleotide adenyltransferase [Winogradskyella jejuensis]SHG91225.1 hypothetical protein SAMN05444148_1258 [Winogradskyella jejuensis]